MPVMAHSGHNYKPMAINFKLVSLDCYAIEFNADYP